MGWQYRRSIKIAPGVRLNVGSKSYGVSIGKRGAHVSVNSKTGTSVSAGLPGSGLSYRQRINGTQSNAETDTASLLFMALIWKLVSGLFLFLISPAGCVTVLVIFIVSAIVISAIVSLLISLFVSYAPLIFAATIAILCTRRNTKLGKIPLSKMLDTGIICISGLIIQLIYTKVFELTTNTLRYAPTQVRQNAAPD